MAMDLGKLAIISMADIKIGHRAREEGGDIMGLAQSIRTAGLIHPIAVHSPTGEAPYQLLAGGRRMLAMRVLKEERISCRIYDRPMNEEELKAVELLENLDRKEFEPGEQIKLVEDIHEYLAKEHNYSLRDTAKFLGRSVGSVSEDVTLSKATRDYPEMQLDKAANKTQAKKIFARAQQAIINRAQIEEVEAQELTLDDITQYILSCYKKGDFFEEAPGLQGGVYNIIEVDPPWGIDEGRYLDGVGDSSYVEADKKNYKSFIKEIAEQCYRLGAEHSWVLWWFGQEWHMEIYEALVSVGYVGTPVPAIWRKTDATNYSRTPYTNLSSHYEPFLYMRKGEVKLNKLARSNIFDCELIHPSQRIHPTERPLKLMMEILDTFGFQGARVLVPFAGSGNTMRACFSINMQGLGYDLSQEFKDAYSIRIIQDRNPSYALGTPERSDSV